MPRSHSLSHSHTPFVALLLSGAAFAQSHLAQFGESVLASGNPAPGLPAGTVVATSGAFNAPAIDRNGCLVFRARFQTNAGLGITTANDAAIYTGRSNGELRLVARAGDQAPGCPAGVLLRNNSATPSNGLNSLPRISPVGEVVLFRSGLHDPSTPSNTPTTADSALFWGPAGAVQLLAREGDLVPFLGNGERYGQIDTTYQSHKMAGAGTVVFHHVLRAGGSVHTGNDSLLVHGTPGNLQVVVREGSPWSGSPGGALVGPVTTFVQANDAGHVLHEVQLQIGSGTPPVTSTDDRVLAVWMAGTDFPVAREGDPAPGLPAGVVFRDVSATQSFQATTWTNFQRAGQVAFRASLAGGGTVAGVDDSALYVGAVGGVSLVARRGDQAPDLPVGVRIGALVDVSIGIDDLGRVAFTAALDGAVTPSDDAAVWAGVPGALQLVAREGDVVSALPASANGPWRFTDLSAARAVLDDRGHVLLPAMVGDGVQSREVWLAFLEAGRVQVVFEMGDPWATGLGTGAITGVTYVGPANGGDGCQSWVNNQGDFTFTATLPAGLGSAIVRGHVGSMQALPAAVPAAGGTQFWDLDAGSAHAGGIYLVGGSMSGTRPGFTFGGVAVPLNQDPWFGLVLGAANGTVYVGSLGTLDAGGRATAQFQFPSGLPGFGGVLIHHAFVVVDPLTVGLVHVSEPTAVRLF